MKANIIRIFILLVIAVLLSGDHRIVSAGNQLRRVRFQITTVGESIAGREILAQTTIEGLPGTDFTVNLQTGNFKMQARFLSDLLINDQLRMRARLNTRRFYGYSPANLPLYEEDEQNQTIEIGSGASVVLLPFGRNSEAETLKIEIIPIVLFVSQNDAAAAKLTIKFDQQLPNGEITVEAVKIPHKFTVEAVLSADGKAIARSAPADCALEEEKELALAATSDAAARSIGSTWKTKLTVDKFIRSRPADLVGINFDFYRGEKAVEDESEKEEQIFISGGAGVGLLGGEISYPIKNTNLPGGADYELKFIIRSATDEYDK